MPAKKQEPKRKSPVTVEQKPDGTFQFHGGKGGFQITEQKNKALEPYGKRIWNYGIVLELLPADKVSALNQQIGNARFVRNNYLSMRITYYKEQKQTLSVAQYKKDYLPELKKQHEFLQLSDKFSLENACRNVDDAYKRFFEGKGGFPRYASSRKPNGNSYTTNYTNHDTASYARAYQTRAWFQIPTHASNELNTDEQLKLTMVPRPSITSSF